MRRSVVVATALTGLAILPSTASAAGFVYGVAAGEVRATSAQLWAHSTATGAVMLQVSRLRSFATMDRQVGRFASPFSDRNVQAVVGGLRPNTTYYYRFVRGPRSLLRSAVGTFRTAPLATTNATIRFAFSGDADAQRARGRTVPFYNRFEIYRRMQLERNHFNVNLGDTIYSDTEVAPGIPLARTVAQKWGKYRQNLALPNLQNLRNSGTLYSHWDDHEFINDFSKAEHGLAIYASGVKAFRDYQPVTYSGLNGLYRSFRWGRNLEVFFLDERSFRSAKASAGGTCNASTGEPDLAPTAPQSSRNLFGVLAPSLKDPPPPGCVARINDPSRTMLGARQYAAFTGAVSRSTARFKVVMNETPIQQFYALPYDRWEGYETERRRLITFLRTRVKNVLFLTTDTHGNLVNDVHLQTLEPGGPDDAKGIVDFVTGPVATKTFSREIGEEINNPAAGGLVTGLFFLRPPPDGVGMRCASTDVYSYMEVSVSFFRVTITPKDRFGRLVRQPQAQNRACGPFTLPYRP